MWTAILNDVNFFWNALSDGVVYLWSGIQDTAINYQHVLPAYHLPLQEDDPGWNCFTMGNRVCGPTLSA
jgi:hypothetical protein